MPVTSRIEQARDEIVTEYTAISQANGYRNDVTVVKVINPVPDRGRTLPEIGVQMGKVRLEPQDGAWTVHDIYVDVWVQGMVSADTDTDGQATNLILAAESLRHDILRKTTEMLNKYRTHTGSKWLITQKQPVNFSIPQLLGKNRNAAAFYSTFTICIKSMNNTFTYEVSGGADGPSADVVIDGGTQ
jgi:hypothetical protein